LGMGGRDSSLGQRTSAHHTRREHGHVAADEPAPTSSRFCLDPAVRQLPGRSTRTVIANQLRARCSCHDARSHPFRNGGGDDKPLGSVTDALGRFAAAHVLLGRPSRRLGGGAGPAAFADSAPGVALAASKGVASWQSRLRSRAEQRSPPSQHSCKSRRAPSHLLARLEHHVSAERRLWARRPIWLDSRHQPARP
jgi:hypothetical protein